jgi:hypothetical protein
MSRTVGRRKFISESDFDFEWERDFPLGLQGNDDRGQSSLMLEFELTPKECRHAKVTTRGKMGIVRVELKIGPSVTEITTAVWRTKGRAARFVKADPKLAAIIGSSFDCQYIPSVRTARSSRDIVETLVARELSALEKNPTFQKALKQIEKIQRPVLRRISTSVTDTLREFLPSVKKVVVDITRENRFRALHRSCSIIVDDGAKTNLQHKGDGVQSLSALSLMRYSSILSAAGKQILLAVEEPETHLHPTAIHQLRSVLQEIAQKHQVILTTHNPLFVARENIASNIVVSGNTAAPASTMADIRKVLGVRPTDNLQRAELVLVVEGEDDKLALISLLKSADKTIEDALASEEIVVDSLLGSGKLSFKLDQLRSTVCPFHCFMDHDSAGRTAVDKASDDGLLKVADVTFAVCKGSPESELEDLYMRSKYESAVLQEFGVRLNVSEFRGNRKWSERMKSVFMSQGKSWSDKTKKEVKWIVAGAIASSPQKALIPQKRGAFDALVTALNDKLGTLRIASQPQRKTRIKSK